MEPSLRFQEARCVMSAVSPRAVVTGMGTLNPLGSTVDETWTAMLSGRSGIAALEEAWAQAGTPDVDPERLAVVIGSGYGGLDTTLAQTRELDTHGPRKVSPHTL